MPPLWLIQAMLKMGVSLPAPESPPLPENWGKMTADEKHEFYVEAFISGESMDFDSPEIADTFKRRAKRVMDCIALKKPDRIPNMFIGEAYPFWGYDTA